MLNIRKSSERGFANHGWLKSYHTFSFADYFAPDFMGFGSLRVINEDFIEGGKGFGTHGHRDMEIITYPISGAIAHKDSTGSSGVILPYEVQKMTAGKGIMHSEFNHLKGEETHLLQIWIEPSETGLEPAYTQKNFKEAIESCKATLLVSPEAIEGSLKIHQDLCLWAKKTRVDDSWSVNLSEDRKYWFQVVKGEVTISCGLKQGLSIEAEGSSCSLSAGDAVAISDEKAFVLTATHESEVLLFDMK